VSPRHPPRWTAWRRAVQATVAALYLALPFLGWERVTGTMVALRAGPLELAEPAAALSALLAGGAGALALAVGVLPVVLLAAILGPVYCSWACPFGLLSEGIDRLRSRGRPWPERSWGCRSPPSSRRRGSRRPCRSRRRRAGWCRW